MDYSPYYFHRNGYRGEDDNYAERSFAKKKGRLSNLLLVLLTALPAVAALIAANFFSDGAIVSSIKSWFGSGGADVYYFLIASEHESETEAVAHATIVRENKGAGFIMESEGKYLVALATYFSASDAESVKQKNAGTEIVEVKATYSALDGIGSKIADDAKKRLKKALGDFNAVSKEYVAGAVSVATAVSELTEVRNDLLILKEEVIESSSPEEDREKVGGLTDAFFSAADSVVSGAFSADEFEAVLRYAVCLMAYSLR